MLLQFKRFALQAFALRQGQGVSPLVITSGGAIRGSALLGSALLLAGMGGCKFDDKQNAFAESRVYKKIHTVEVKPLDSEDAVSAPLDVATDSHAAKPAPAPEDNALLQENPSGQPNQGERAVGWRGLYDVYWKLNWARKELLTSHVPSDLAEVIISTRKHCKRLANEFPKLEGMDERLAPANSALDHLESGLQQMNDLAALDEAGLQWRAMPWGMGVDEMHRYLERMGLVGPTAKASFSVSTPLIENDDAGSAAKPDATRPYVTSRQRDAIALVLRGERENHASPEELARSQFQTGLRDIIHLRELCRLTYHPSSVQGDDAVISGPLYLEKGSPSQPARQFAPLDKSAAPDFDPTAAPGQHHSTPLVR